MLELVRDRNERTPLSLWSELDPGLRELVAKARAAGVSFAVRGNLILLAPPLVIAESDLNAALALLDRLLGELEQGLAAASASALSATPA